MAALASLGWQVYSFFLAGGRGKVEIGDRIGLDDGRAVRLIGVSVRNLGRQPISVTWVGLYMHAIDDHYPYFQWPGEETLPVTLEPGHSKSFVMKEPDVRSFLDQVRHRHPAKPRATLVSGEAGFGSGKTARSKGTYELSLDD
ncbi:MAG: hypothetical protein AB7O78_09830 [Thermoleophilia bacterium]